MTAILYTAVYSMYTVAYSRHSYVGIHFFFKFWNVIHCSSTYLVLDSRLTDGGKVVSLTRRSSFTPQENSWYSFLLEAESTPGP
jgi:hypothetical protein